MPTQVITARDLPEIRADLVAWLVDPAKYGGPAVWSANLEGEKAIAERRLARRWSGILAAAPLFFVGEGMTDLAVASGLTLPTYQLHHEDLPTQQGLLVWEHPVTSTRYGDELNGAPLTAASWKVNEDGVEILFWAKREDWLQGLARDMPGMRKWTTETVDQVRIFYPQPLVFLSRSFLTFGKKPGWLRHTEIEDGLSLAALEERVQWQSDLEQAERALLVTWLLMGQTLTREEERQPSKAAAKRVRRSAPELATAVRYTELRHAAPTREAVRDGAGVVYRHQWVVRGHWRNHWFPARQTHRPIWISDYVKGPDGAPLLDPDKLVNVLRR